MRREKGEYRVGIGSSSVLMILVVLAMTALSLLALGSARQTEAQTRRNLQASLGYYEAAARVQRALSEIDGAALAYVESGATEPISAEWFAGRVPESVAWSSSDALEFTISEDIGDGRALAARGVVRTEGGARYTLASHELVAARVDSEQSLLLMGE